MSTNLEGLVRPFETSDVTPPEKVPQSQITPIRNAIINAGSGGSVKTMSGSFNLTQTYYMIKRPKEKQQQ